MTGSTTLATGSLPVRLITHNVRYATKTPFPGEAPWAERCPKLCAQLNFLTAGRDSAFICLQEVLHSQLGDVSERMGELWAHIGLGRDDGLMKGEYSPVFYKLSTWWCERNQTLWLSQTPEKPSKGWDAVLPRVVTVGRFRHKTTGARVVVMSTHLDHRGKVARRESARLLLRIAAEWADGGGGDRTAGEGGGNQDRDETAAAGKSTAVASGPLPIPVFLGGDFNSRPDGGAYKEITSPETGAESGMVDISSLVPRDQRYGNEITYTSFGELYETPSRIDFLFVRDPTGIRFLTFGVMANRFDDDVLLSDHRAVVADMDIPIYTDRGSS